MKRIPILLLLAAVVAGSTSACTQTSPYAAIVNGTIIPASAMNDEIHAITSNPRYSAVLDQGLSGSGSGGLQPGGKNTMNGAYVAQLVFNRVRVALIEQEEARLHVTPTDAMRKQALASLIGSNGDPALVDSLAANYRNYLIDRQAEITAVTTAMNTPQAQLAYYNKNLSKFEQTCVRHILLPTQAAADGVRQRLVANGDWAAIAKAESLDSQGAEASAGKGGDLGCFSDDDLNGFIAPFAAAVKGLETGVVSQPVQTQFGFHVIQVTKRVQQSFADAQPQISKTLSDISSFLDNALKTAKIKVNPKYGQYRPADDGTGAPASIVPHQPVVLSDGTTATAPDNSLLGGASPGGSGAPANGSGGPAASPDGSGGPTDGSATPPDGTS